MTANKMLTVEDFAKELKVKGATARGYLRKIKAKRTGRGYTWESKAEMMKDVAKVKTP